MELKRSFTSKNNAAGSVSCSRIGKLVVLTAGIVAMILIQNRLAPSLSQRPDQQQQDHDTVSWAKNKKSNNVLPFTLENTPACHAFLTHSSLLQTVAEAAVEDWFQRQQQSSADSTTTSSSTTSSPAMEQASNLWDQAMEACHGPIPAYLKDSLSLRSFVDGMVKCGDPHDIQRGGLSNLFAGEWCTGDWRSLLRPLFHNNPTRRVDMIPKLMETAHCALHLEFPLVNNNKTLTTSVSSPPVHHHTVALPKRVILIALAMGNKKPWNMACKLVSTAVPRGWDVVLAVGDFGGLKYKYTYTLQALDILMAQQQDEEAEKSLGLVADETLVVFADAADVLIQQSPQFVLQSFQQQQQDHPTRALIFSAEPNCFPVGIWPHSLGIPHALCGDTEMDTTTTTTTTTVHDAPFPLAEPSTSVQEGRKYVNTGGWLGMASNARWILQELDKAITTPATTLQHEHCYQFGTDQLLGNAAFLRFPTIVGLDANYQFFAGGSWSLINNNLTWRQTTTNNDNGKDSKDGGGMAMAYCNGNKCPAFLHFNGGGNEGGVLQEAYESLTSPQSLPTCPTTTTSNHGGSGSVTIVNVDTRTIQTLRFHDLAHDPSWKKCLHGKACFSNIKL